MQDEIADGGSPANSGYGSPQWWEDARRWSDGNIRGLNQKAVGALTDKKNEMFAEIRAVPWKLNLAKEITYFARSADVSSSVWPYERFEARLARIGTPIPDGVSIAHAVEEVLSDLERLSQPKTKGSMADGTWYEKNVARPLSERFAAASLGVGSFSELESAESGLIKVSAGMSRGRNDPSPWADWLRGRTKDLDLETLAILHMDVLRAPRVLRDRLRLMDEDRAAVENPADQPRDFPATNVQISEHHARLVEAAIDLAEAIARQSITLTDFRFWLWSASEGPLIENSYDTEPSPAGKIMQLITGSVESPNASEAREFTTRVAHIYYAALSASRDQNP